MNKRETVEVNDVVVDQEVYPRDDMDQETVNKYRKSLDRLPPILVTHENILVDGYHRLVAHRVEQQETIEAQVEDIPRDEVLWEATKRNATHGLQLKQNDKRALGKDFYDDGRLIGDIAEALSVTEKTVRRWTKKQRQKEDEQRDQTIIDMYLACHTWEEIAEATGFEEHTGALKRFKSIVKNRQLSEIHKPDSLQLYNIWKFSKPDDRYGMDYPGRIPGQILENVLYYYTELFDTVIDPFGGGGTTVDVCKERMRRYQVYDINPVREEIDEHDITEGFPDECNGSDLIFLDPPYAQQKQGDYSGHETNLANLPVQQFYAAMENIFSDAADILKQDGYLVFIVGPSQNEGVLEDHAFELVKRAEQYMSYTYRVSVPYTTEQHGGAYVNMAKENQSMLYLNRDVVVMKNE